MRADFGQELAIRIVDDFGEGRYPPDLTPDEVKGVLAAEIEKVLEPVAKPLEITRAALRHPGRRRQRLRQDHHHRQAGRALPQRRQVGDAGGRRHFPRRRHRPAQDLGRAHRRVHHGARAGRRRREPCLRRHHRRQGARHRDRAGRHRRPPAEPRRADERTGKDGARDAQSGAGSAACGAAGARRHRRAERAAAGGDIRQDRRVSPAWS